MGFQRVALNQHEYGKPHNQKDKRILARYGTKPLIWSMKTVEDRLIVYEARTQTMKMEKLEKETIFYASLLIMVKRKNRIPNTEKSQLTFLRVYWNPRRVRMAEDAVSKG